MPPEESERHDWFRDSVLPHEPMLRAWLRGRFSANCPINDIIQETYLRAVKAQSLGKLFAPKAFLFLTARNLAIDQTRRTKTSRSESLAESGASDVMDEAEPVPDAVARKQEVAILNQAIASLPPKCREIFVMRRVKGMSQAEIARALGLSTNTVSAQLTIGLRKCAAFFEQYNGKETK